MGGRSVVVEVVVWSVSCEMLMLNRDRIEGGSRDDVYVCDVVPLMCCLPLATEHEHDNIAEG